MEELIKVILMGIVEGLTEFLPVSSTGHLIVTASLVNLNPVLRTTFEVFIQVGAVVAVMVFYRAELLQQVRAVGQDAQVRHFWAAILLAFLPAAAIGFLLSDWIDEVLFRPVVVGLALIVGGILFLLVERYYTPKDRQTELTEVTFRQALLVGLWQIAALIPGMSRSGMTILGGLFGGMNRSLATKFSFYLAIPTLGIATAYSLLRKLDTLSGNDLVLLLIGATISGIVAWASIVWLLRYVSTHNFVIFGYYRILAGLVILALVLAGVLV